MHDNVGSKLITQNLLTSATLFETPHPPDWASIQDLGVLINLFCLYDNVIVLGREANPQLVQTTGSSIYAALDNQRFVQMHQVVDKELAKEISLSARSHLRSVLPPDVNLDRYDTLMKVSLQPSNVQYGLSAVPDRGQDYSSIPQ